MWQIEQTVGKQNKLAYSKKDWIVDWLNSWKIESCNTLIIIIHMLSYIEIKWWMNNCAVALTCESVEERVANRTWITSITVLGVWCKFHYGFYKF